jgi:hypothetical protein
MKYPRVTDGDWVRPFMKGYRMMCCDCGLVHVVNFRVRNWKSGAKVEFQAVRHKRATACTAQEETEG